MIRFKKFDKLTQGEVGKYFLNVSALTWAGGVVINVFEDNFEVYPAIGGLVLSAIFLLVGVEFIRKSNEGGI